MYTQHQGAEIEPVKVNSTHKEEKSALEAILQDMTLNKPGHTYAYIPVWLLHIGEQQQINSIKEPVRQFFPKNFFWKSNWTIKTRLCFICRD